MKKSFFVATLIVLLFCSCKFDKNPAAHRGIYHWKTTYNPSEWELQWMKDHKVDRLYIKLFDVEAGNKVNEPDWAMVPIATTNFKQRLPEMDVVPVVYITTDAIRALDFQDIWQWYDRCEKYATLIVKRIDDMMSEHYGGRLREVQIDCDWTQQTERTYFELAERIKRKLHNRGIILSGTLRLHQLHEANIRLDKEEKDSIPFDRSLLMCYNTGRLQSPDTKNSILDYDDAAPYLKQYWHLELPRTDVAYPVYGWGVEFDEKGNFQRLINSHQLPKQKSNRIREEWGNIKEIRAMQRALPELDSLHTVIFYHLDSLNLSKYSYEDIEKIYTY